MANDAADEWIDRAWDARTPAARAKNARKALALDPEAIDAYVILALSSDAPAERSALLREAVRIGKRRWAEEIKRPSQHHFWLDIKTRPFMRAAHNLALSLWEQGERDEAASLAGFLLKLNPNDNQGIRYLALDWNGALGNWNAVGRLLKRYRDDAGTGYLYAAALDAFRKGDGADALLNEARETNPHVPELLTGSSPMPEQSDLPYVEFGSREEAAGYVRSGREAWSNVPGALEWLHEMVS